MQDASYAPWKETMVSWRNAFHNGISHASESLRPRCSQEEQWINCGRLWFIAILRVSLGLFAATRLILNLDVQWQSFIMLVYCVFMIYSHGAIVGCRFMKPSHAEDGEEQRNSRRRIVILHAPMCIVHAIPFLALHVHESMASYSASSVLHLFTLWFVYRCWPMATLVFGCRVLNLMLFVARKYALSQGAMELMIDRLSLAASNAVILVVASLSFFYSPFLEEAIDAESALSAFIPTSLGLEQSQVPHETAAAQASKLELVTGQSGGAAQDKANQTGSGVPDASEHRKAGRDRHAGLSKNIRSSANLQDVLIIVSMSGAELARVPRTNEALASIENLRQHIVKRTGIPPSQQRLSLSECILTEQTDLRLMKPGEVITLVRSDPRWQQARELVESLRADDSSSPNWVKTCRRLGELGEGALLELSALAAFAERTGHPYECRIAAREAVQAILHASCAAFGSCKVGSVSDDFSKKVELGLWQIIEESGRTDVLRTKAKRLLELLSPTLDELYLLP